MNEVDELPLLFPWWHEASSPVWEVRSEGLRCHGPVAYAPWSADPGCSQGRKFSVSEQVNLRRPRTLLQRQISSLGIEDPGQKVCGGCAESAAPWLQSPRGP